MADGPADRRAVRIAEPLAFEEPYELVAREQRTPTIVELWLQPLGGALDYLPGEYVLLQDRERRVPPRSFSIANAPRPDGLISLLVTRVCGGEASTWVHERLRVGELVAISGPYGTFVDDPTSTAPDLFLAAGSGLAPIRALLEAGLAAAARCSLTLVFSARSDADVIDHDRFAAWQAQHPRFRFIRTLTRDAGPRPHDRIPALLPRLYRDLSDHASSRAPPASSWPARPPPTRSERRVPACTRRCSSSSRSRGRAPRHTHRSGGERDRRPRISTDLHQDR